MIMIEVAAASPEGHVLVCGLGRPGFRIVELLLALGERVTVVTLAARPDWRRSAEDAGATIVEGDARDVAVLLESGLGSCRALVAATDADVVNLEVALDARAARADLPIVVRLFDRALLRELPGALDLNAAHALSALAAPAFGAAAMGESVLASFSDAAGAWVVGRATSTERVPPERILETDSRGVVFLAPRAEWRKVAGLPEPESPGRPGFGSALALPARVFRSSPRPLRILAATLGALILVSALVFYFGLGLSAVDAVYFLITTVTTTGYGDINLKDAPAAIKLYGCLVMLLGSAMIAILISMLTDFAIRTRLKELAGREEVTRSGHTVVVGLGGVGTRVVEELLLGSVPPVGIERDSEAPLLSAGRDRIPVVLGDGRFDQTLERAGIRRAEAVVAVTGDDATNLAVALAARRLNPGIRTVVRLFDADFARKAGAGLKLSAALSASRIAAPAFVASSFWRGVKAAFVSDTRLFAIVGRAAGVEWRGARPSELAARGVRILSRKAEGDSALSEGEELLALVTRELKTSLR